MQLKFKTSIIAFSLLNIFASNAFSMAQKPLSAPVSAGSGSSGPSSSGDQRSYVVGNTSLSSSSYSHLDPNRLVPADALTNAIRYYDLKKSRISNQRYVTVVDMTQSSNSKRMYIIDMNSGAVSSYYSAHGAGSDTNNDTYAERFSNSSGSNMTSIGFYLTGNEYSGAHGSSMVLYGLESTNNNADERAIVMHGADYVTPSHTGRSWGCPAVEMKYINGLVDALKGGSLFYIFRR